MKENEQVVVYMTKYALTTGIEHGAVELDSPYVYRKLKYGNRIQYSVKDWYRTREEANKRVLEMLRTKRVSLEKSLKKLDKLESQLKAGMFKLVECDTPDAS